MPGRCTASPESRACPVLTQRAQRENRVRGHRMGGRDWPIQCDRPPARSSKAERKMGDFRALSLEPRNHRNEELSFPPTCLLLVRIHCTVRATCSHREEVWTPLVRNVPDLDINAMVFSVRATKTVLKRTKPSREGTKQTHDEVIVYGVSTGRGGKTVQEASQPWAGGGHSLPPGLSGVGRVSKYRSKEGGCGRRFVEGTQASWAGAEGALAGGHWGEKAVSTGSPWGHWTGGLETCSCV